jgi:hypothetical protein
MKRRLPRRLSAAPVCVMILAGGCAGDSAIEYVPQANGDKPEVFELGHVQVCPVTDTGLTLLIRRVDVFAQRHGMIRHPIQHHDERVAAVYTRGAPMREHLMVERLHAYRYRVGISTVHGFECEDLCGHATAYDFCPRVVGRQ